jgi:hypothetical protein
MGNSRPTRGTNLNEGDLYGLETPIPTRTASARSKNPQCAKEPRPGGTVAMLLEAVYEQEFLNCSYGFRPKRSAHQALDALSNAAWGMDGGWVIELDIQKYFDSIDHERLREVIGQRVRDGVIQRLLGKWLSAGVTAPHEAASYSTAASTHRECEA